MTFGERIIAMRKAKNISQTALAKVMGITQPTIHEYERDRVSPSIQAIQNISQAYNVNLHWLLTGDGEMDISGNIRKADNYEELEQKIERTIEKKMATYFKSGMPMLTSPQKPNYEEINDYWMLHIKGEIACGAPIEFLEDTSERLIPVSKRILQSPNDCDILRVNGDSMNPDIEHSDLVVLRRETDWMNCNNKIVAVRNSDGLTLKKLVHDERKRSALLIASNKKYLPIMVDDSCELCGYLILLIRYF